MTDEKRKSSEQRIERNITTQILALTGEPIIDCILKNVSGRGACISVADFPEVVPDFFRLKIDEIQPKCRVKWRSGNDIGIEFYDTATSVRR